MNKTIVFELQTFPASSCGLSITGLTQYRKELIKVGKYIHPATKVKFEVTIDTLKHWVNMFTRWYAAGNHVSIPLGHARVDNPEDNAGWVTGMSVEGNSLIGIMELSDPKLSLTTDVSICVEGIVKDGKGVEYSNIITHVSLCTDPVIAGLGKFTKLSLSIGETDMKVLEKIGKALGLKSEESTEEAVMLALANKTKSDKKETELIESVNQVVDPLVKLVSENRALKLSNLVKAGLITPAVKDVITAKYIEVKVLALSMASKQEDGFDILYDVLVQNKPVNLDEVTGVQSLELTNKSVAKPNAMTVEVNKRRKAAGIKD